MQRMAPQPQITSSNVQVTYVRKDDAGYVGQTSRPLTIEVSLQGLSYRWTFFAVLTRSAPEHNSNGHRPEDGDIGVMESS